MTLHFSGTGAGDKGDPGPRGPKGEKGESAPLPSGPISKQKDLETVQDFLITLGIKPSLHILKIIICSLNHVIVRPTKIMNNIPKVCKICTFKVIFDIKNQPNLSDFFFCEEYVTRRSTFMNEKL